MKVTYSVDDVLELIKMYHVNLINVREYKKEYRSVGVSVITDEIMGSGGISDPVQSEAFEHINNSLFFSELRTDINYLESRLYKVEGERNKEVLRLRMNGLSVIDISEILGVSRATIYRLLEKVAKQIVAT